MRKCLLAVFAALSTIALVSCDTPPAQDFVKKGVKFSVYVGEVGKLASERGQSEAVKQFSQDLVRDLGGVGDELKDIAQAEKIDVDLPSKIDKRQEKWMATLNHTAPEAFDKIYAQHQFKALARAAELFDRYAEDGGNEALKQYAANKVTVLKQHLEQAKKLLQ
jgi:putative membrane protein